MWGSSLGARFGLSAERRLWWKRFAIVMLILTACIAAPASYDNTKVYFTGDKVSAQISECHVAKGRKSTGYRCTGTWVLNNGTKGSGALRGVNDRYTRGEQVAVRATAKSAISDGGPWAPVTFAVGILAIIAVLGLAIGSLRRRRARAEVNQLVG